MTNNNLSELTGTEDQVPKCVPHNQRLEVYTGVDQNIPPNVFVMVLNLNNKVNEISVEMSEIQRDAMRTKTEVTNQVKTEVDREMRKTNTNIFQNMWQLSKEVFSNLCENVNLIRKELSSREMVMDHFIHNFNLNMAALTNQVQTLQDEMKQMKEKNAYYENLRMKNAEIKQENAEIKQKNSKLTATLTRVKDEFQQ